MAAKRKAVASRKKAGKSGAKGKAPARATSAAKKGGAARGVKPHAAKRTKKTPTVDAVARRIVRATLDPSKFSVADLYAEDCSSTEPGTPAFVGQQALQQKMAMWEQMQEGTTWRARNVFIKGNTIGIEWEADVKLRGGPTVRFEEVAIHEVKGGKIVNERYYYDRAQMTPPAEETPPPSTSEEPEEPPEPEFPPPDPLDL
ncbi:MAG: nuclear transport factor 2 family protein [Planctomycetota bacterium]|jgi:ketosteroid isomerase-like protein